MFQNQQRTTTNHEPDPTVRLGVFSARIGMQHAHRIGIEIPLARPEYATATLGAIGTGVRTSIDRTKQNYRYGQAGHPTHALPGATVYLEIQDISRLEPRLAQQVKWVCSHHDCAGKHFVSPSELIQSHPDEIRLRQQSQTETVYGSAVKGRPHMYMGVLEIPAEKEKKDDKGNVIKPATEPTVMLLSGEL